MITVSNMSLEVNDKRSDFFKLVNSFLPLMFTLCTTGLIGFFDRLFLANCSMAHLEGYVTGSVLAITFQIPFMRLTTFGQAFVSSYNNENERHRIGESVWQMIWLSLLSILVAVPVGYAIMPFIFKDSLVQKIATQYFTWMLWGNFLFPLQAALSSFFIGQNRTKVVFGAVVAGQCLHVLLDYLLIFGVENYIPSLGVLGAAISLIISQMVVCGILFAFLLNKNQRRACRTDCYYFNVRIFYNQVRKGAPVAIAPFIAISAWTGVSCIMATKGPDHLMIFSVGNTLTLCFSFISDALFQIVMTFASAILKKKDFFALKQLITHSILLLCIIVLMLSIPFLIYPNAFLSLLIPTLHIPLKADLLLLTCYSSWLFLFCKGLLFIGMGLQAATQKTSFFIATACTQWVTGYLAVFLAMNFFDCQAVTFWLLTSINIFIISTLYFLKTRAFYNQSLQASAP